MEKVLEHITGKDIAREIMRYVITHEKHPMKLWSANDIGGGGNLLPGILPIDRIDGDLSASFYWTDKWVEWGADLFCCESYLKKLCYSREYNTVIVNRLAVINIEIRMMCDR